MTSLLARMLLSVAAATLIGTLFNTAVVVFFGPQWPLVGGVWLATAALATLFLRRVAAEPLQRIIGLVTAADRVGLRRIGTTDASDLAVLSRGIIAMTQQIEDDRAKIVAQLEALRAAHERLRSTQAQLVRAERLAVVGQLAAGLAHEIGNPLTVLGGFLAVLGDEALPPAERRDALQRMQKELDRIQRTVRQLLDYARAPKETSSAGDVAVAIEHVAQLLAVQDRARVVQISWPETASSWPAVAIDTERLVQVLINLLLNAVDAVAAGGHVRVAVRCDDRAVVLSVADSGPGVPADVGAKIFEPFFTTKPAGRGTGLGLAVCEQIVSAGGGQIELAPSELGGACFVVTLPVAAARE